MQSRPLRVSLYALLPLALSTLSACELDQDGTMEAADDPCSPIDGRQKALEGELDVALSGGGRQFFTLRGPDTPQRRLFEKGDILWREIKVNGSGLGGGKGKTEVHLSFNGTQDRQGVLGYEIENNSVTWAGFTETEEDPESKSDIESDPGFVALSSIKDFTLPSADKIQTLGLKKRLGFFAKFHKDEYLVVVRADEQQSALYIGTQERMQAPEGLEVVRFKDGGTVIFNFRYQGTASSLELPRKIFDFEDPKDQKAPKLVLDEIPTPMSEVHDSEVPSTLIEDLTFYGCEEAHPED